MDHSEEDYSTEHNGILKKKKDTLPVQPFFPFVHRLLVTNYLFSSHREFQMEYGKRKHNNGRKDVEVLCRSFFAEGPSSLGLSEAPGLMVLWGYRFVENT